LRRRRRPENISAVTLTEAWTELGVEPGADAETVRRAYLRLIKTRKPESDPVGFQRARTAFEVARADGEIESLAAESVRRHAPAFSGSSGGPGAPGAPPSPAPGGAAGDGAAQGDIVFEGFRSAWQSIRPSADQRQRLEIAREAVAVLPHDPRAHWLLVSTLSHVGTETALADALRAGWRAGFPEFLEALLVRLPTKATREEIDAGFASQEAAVRLAAAVAAAGWNAPRGAALVVELCRTAMEAPLDARDDRVRELPMLRLLDVVLALHAAGALDAAAEAQAALRACLHDSGLELALAAGPLGGVWLLTEEIGGLPPEFPRPLRAAFAFATRAGDLQSAYVDTCRAIELDRSEVSLWASNLSASAPNVSGIMRAALSNTRAETAERAGFQFSRLGWVLIPMFLALGRLCTSSSPSSRPPISPIEVTTGEPAYLPTPRSSSILPGSASGFGIDQLAQAADDLCGPSGSRYGQLVCADIQAFVETLRARECGALPERLIRIKRALPAGSRGESEQRFFSRVTIARWQTCDSGGQAKTESDTP
jgi:hypothetical protein